MSIWYYDGEEFTDTNASHHMLLYKLSNEHGLKTALWRLLPWFSCQSVIFMPPSGQTVELHRCKGNDRTLFDHLPAIHL